MPDIVSMILAAGGPVDLSEADEPQIDEAVDELLDHPAGSSLFRALCEAGTATALAGALSIARRTDDPGILAEIVRVLSGDLRLDEGAVRSLHRTLLARSADASAHVAVRSHSLMAAFVLSNGRPALTRLLQAHLLEIASTDDGDYLRHASKVMGLLLAQVADADLLAVLHGFLAVPEAEDEAAMALGLLTLADALDEPERLPAVERFESARALFLRASRATEVRLDADLLAHCVELLLAFGQAPGPEVVAGRMRDVRAAAFEWSAHLVPRDRPVVHDAWTASPSMEAVHWGSLAFRLEALERSLGQRTWLDGATVVEEELLKVYAASRTVFRRDAEGGLEAVVHPRILGALQRERAQLDMLEAWIERREGAGSERDAAIDLRAAVVAAKEASVLRHPHEAVAGRPTAVALVEDSHLSATAKAEAIRSLRNALVDFDIGRSDPVVVEIWHRLHERLLANGDYRSSPAAATLFDVILFHTLAFLHSRENLAGSSTTGTDYLFDLDTTNPPLEDDLHRDYYGFLQATPLRPLAKKEVPGVGHGRSDVFFQDGGIHLVAELKKTDRNADLAGLVDRFGLQTVSYQRTNVTFCLLMVLDLVDRGGGGGHLRELVDLIEKTPAAGKTTYSVVVMRVQGRKRSPSSVIAPRMGSVAFQPSR